MVCSSQRKVREPEEITSAIFITFALDMSFKPKKHGPIPSDIFRKIYGEVPHNLECEIRNNIDKKNLIKGEMRKIENEISSMSYPMRLLLIFTIINKKKKSKKLNSELCDLNYKYSQLIMQTLVYNHIYKAQREIDERINENLVEIEKILLTPLQTHRNEM